MSVESKRASSPAARRRSERPTTWLKRVTPRQLLPFAIFLGVAIAVVGWHMHKYPYLSPIDENAHFDYIRILPEIPDPGDRLSQDTLRLTACRAYDPNLSDVGLAKYAWPACNSETFDPNAYPAGGYSSAGSTAPFYYFVTAAMTRPIAYVSDAFNLLNLARIANVFWLTGLMSVSYLVARRIRASRLAAGASAILVATSSDMVTSAATLGPDTATGLTAGLVMLGALAWDGRRRTTLLLLLAVAVAGVTKLTAFTGVGAAIVFLCVNALVGRRRPDQPSRRATFALAGGMGLLFTALSTAWYLRPTDGAAPPAAAPVPDAPTFLEVIPWSELWHTVFYRFVPPNVGNFNAPFLEGSLNVFLEMVSGGLAVMGVLLAVFALRKHPRVGALGCGVAVMALLGPVLLTFLNAYAYDLYYVLPSRYGYGLLAGFAALAAWAFRGAGGSRALALLASLSFLNLFF